MPFAKWTYRIAGIYGLIVLLPMYFAVGQIEQQKPPAVTHVEFYYGFVGLAVTWQLLFLLISTDVHRYRRLMPVSWLEKLVFGVPVMILAFRGQVGRDIIIGGVIDLALGLLFVVSWVVSEPHGDID